MSSSDSRKFRKRYWPISGRPLLLPSNIATLRVLFHEKSFFLDLYPISAPKLGRVRESAASGIARVSPSLGGRRTSQVAIVTNKINKIWERTVTLLRAQGARQDIAIDHSGKLSREERAQRQLIPWRHRGYGHEPGGRHAALGLPAGVAVPVFRVVSANSSRQCFLFKQARCSNPGVDEGGKQQGRSWQSQQDSALPDFIICRIWMEEDSYLKQRRYIAEDDEVLEHKTISSIQMP
uniref:DET1- and DDB1-associated protein 1 n=1 Tax=Steinernema glaseri TaxID=37863 RepID=A0A1I8AQN3_9BILA